MDVACAFKDESRRQQFLANRFRRREILPRRRMAELRLEETRQALGPLMEVIAALGRLPDPTEFAGAQEVGGAGLGGEEAPVAEGQCEGNDLATGAKARKPALRL